jgi:4-diphosphocytidyl-2-C-methyl-D-erythritol kinase
MLTFPNCKINIGLFVTEKREGGFHNIESVFYPVPWLDALEIIEAETLSIEISGQDIPGDPSTNLCLKAWHLLKKDFTALPPVALYLHKVIPTGAGLGGGSSNGTHMLQLLNQKFNLHLSKEQLIGYAAKLGSDCPFFAENTPCIATGRGEILTPIPFSLKGYHLVLVNPGIHIATPWAFRQITPTAANLDWEKLNWSKPETWQAAGLINVFQAPVIKEYSALQKIIDILFEQGAAYAAMSGSGSTFYGIFEQAPSGLTLLFPEKYLVKTLPL